MFFSSQNEDLASLAAQQYYVEYGTDINVQRLQGLLTQYIPDSCLAGSGTLERWMVMVLKALKEVGWIYNLRTTLSIVLLCAHKFMTFLT